MVIEEMLHHVSCVVFDLETTGFSHQDRIVEIAAVRLEEWQPVAEFHTLVNPGIPMPSRAASVHQISDEMLQDAPSFAEIAPGLAHLLQGALLVGHNIFSFDLRFLNAEMRQVYGSGLDHIATDTLRLARLLLPRLKQHKLEILSDLLGIPLIAHHAMSDVYATAEIWLHLVGKLVEKGFRKVADLERYKALRELDGSGLPWFENAPEVRLLPR